MSENRKDRLKAARSTVGEKLAEASKPNPSRRMLRALVQEPDEEHQPPTDTTAVASAVDVLQDNKTFATEQVDTQLLEPGSVPVNLGAQQENGLPGWRDLASPPAPRGTSDSHRRLNIPVDETLITLLNDRDLQIVSEGGKATINRSELIASAITVFAADQERWVGEWQSVANNYSPANATLQGRVSEEQYDQLRLLRFTQNDKGTRTVNTGPILSVIVRRILSAG